MEDGALNGAGGLGHVSVSPPSVVPDICRGMGHGGWELSLKVKVATSFKFLAQAGN